MKQTNSQKIRLGVFVIISTILFVLAVYLIGQGKHMFKSTFTVNAYFQNVNGLQEGNNVRYAGINIGTVSSIEMENDSTIKVAMSIDEKIVNHIKKNAIATIGSDGLVGNMIVNIVPGKGPSSVVSDNDTIKTFSKIGADDILSTLSVSSENAAILTSDILKITNAILEGKGTLGILLNDTVMAKDLQLSVRNLKLASRGATKSINEINDLISSIKGDDNTVLGVLLNDSISGHKLKTVVTNLETSSEEINKILKDVNTVVSDINTRKGTLDYVVRDTSLVNSLKSTMKNINEGTDKFNQNMEALKHNFLFRGYFRKLEKEEQKNKKE
ncbi:MlaD family protein [Tenacibaculum sp. IB213877]|uniref:MlaD family protein n=1 Tax=Tenacibaculum sp. IB213877 TaxID=3097351 RepID=UPI002A59A51E|nr:MlaD family protein [Tenacibaculum sp. IB213877]MDY0780885.1 MlaD family protein [Tenacibaculum sp. IB213877]